MIDPYPSDSLAEKYWGAVRPHVCMMPPPVEPSGFRDVDFVLRTHVDSDHMDPGLPGAHAQPASGTDCAVGGADQALLSGVEEKRIIFDAAGGTISVATGPAVAPTRAAHERLDTTKRATICFSSM